MHDSVMNDELRDFQTACKKWIEAEITPYHEEWESKGITPKELYKKAGEQGLLCIGQSEEYGGMGLDFRYACVLTEELAYALASGVMFFLHSDIVAPYIEHYASEEQKKMWLPKFANGEIISAIAMTEPNTGSDLQGIATKAVLDGDEWVLNGAKTFISNGHIANFYVVIAETTAPEGKKLKYKPLSLFVVEEGNKGFSKGRNLSKIGLKAQDTAELSFTNCRVPKENLVGKQGEAFLYMSNELAQERLSVAVWCNAAAKRCLDEALAYTQDRKAFDTKISDFQNTRFKLAEVATQIQVAEAFCDRVIAGHVAGKNVNVEAAMAKYWSSEMLGKVSDECLQLHGGYGYMMEYPIAKTYIDARVQRIYAGSTEIMKRIISNSLLK